MSRWASSIGWIMGALGVGLGALAAHGLKGRFDDQALGWWHTAAQYQMFHALALLAAGRMAREGRRFAGAASGCFFYGTLIFSGSLYVMTVTGARWLGAITPIGGVLLILGWILGALASRQGAE